MRLIACGSRTFSDQFIVNSTLLGLYLTDDSPNGMTLIQGGAPGADNLAKQWAENFLTLSLKPWHIEIKADWDEYGRAAGPIRNKKMLDELLSVEDARTLVVAFLDKPREESKGTRNMLELAESAEVQTYTVKV